MSWTQVLKTTPILRELPYTSVSEAGSFIMMYFVRRIQSRSHSDLDIELPEGAYGNMSPPVNRQHGNRQGFTERTTDKCSNDRDLCLFNFENIETQQVKICSRR